MTSHMSQRIKPLQLLLVVFRNQHKKRKKDMYDSILAYTMRYDDDGERGREALLTYRK